LAVHIRLRRTGKTKAPTYRVVVADSRSPRDGKFIEILGHYNPRTEEGALVLDTDRVRHWINNGAKPTSTARALIVRSGIPDAEVPPVAR
jgi:small subunit ribosomal protein S16